MTVLFLSMLVNLCLNQNTTKEQMEMTTPVYTRKSPSDGEKMEMTTPVITKKVSFPIFLSTSSLTFGGSRIFTLLVKCCVVESMPMRSLLIPRNSRALADCS